MTPISYYEEAAYEFLSTGVVPGLCGRIAILPIDTPLDIPLMPPKTKRGPNQACHGKDEGEP